MTMQYNVNIVGNLTNNNGVLGDFSLNNYATLPETLQGLSINDLEIVFKFKIADNSSDNMIFWTDSLSNPPVGGLRLYNSNTSYSYGLEVTSNGGQVGYVESEGNLLIPNTYYFVKVTYSNSSGYGLYRSEDGIDYTLIGTIPNTTMPSNPLGIIGTGGWDTYLHGAIDLNESYIKVNGATWWRGAESITKIQLRHDTAANWTSVNPVLLEGEVGIETDTRKQKFGDGVTAWNSLPYDLGSTALQSITSSNVTNALGYTPVNKAGDTMSGILSFSKTGSGVISLNAIPEGGYSDMQYVMTGGLRAGFVRASNVSATERYLQISVCNNSGSPTSNFILRCNNDVASCTFPNTTCCDGQWVYSYSFLTNSVAATKTTISLSSYLPNNNYNYEVMGVFGRDNVNSAEKYLVSSDLFNPQFNTTSGQFCVSFVTGGYTRANNTSFILPVGAGRCLYTIGSNASTGDMYLYVLGYRRIGTNA